MGPFNTHPQASDIDRPSPLVRSTRHRLLTVGISILTAAIVSGACAKGAIGTDESRVASSAATSGKPAGSEALPSAPSVGGQNSTGQGSSGQKPTGQGSSGQKSTGPGSSGQPSTAPLINSFSTPESIDCHNGAFQEFTAKWSTTNATKVTISIDGPGVYNTYPANGETSLPFNCSSSHTFTLTAYSPDNKTATKTITLQPRNVQPPTTPDDE